MGMFSGVSKRKLTKYEKLYFEPNDYIIEIDECKHINGENGESLIVSGKVIAKGKDTGIRPELGETAAWVQPVSKVKTSIWQSSLMEFLCSQLECEPEEYDDDQWEEIISEVFEKNDWKGELCKLKTVGKETKSGGDFTKHIWLGEPSESDWDKYEIILEDD